MVTDLCLTVSEVDGRACGCIRGDPEPDLCICGGVGSVHGLYITLFIMVKMKMMGWSDCIMVLRVLGVAFASMAFG